MIRELTTRLIDLNGNTIDELVNPHILRDDESPIDIQNKLPYQAEVERLIKYAETHKALKSEGYIVIVQIGGSVDSER